MIDKKPELKDLLEAIDLVYRIDNIILFEGYSANNYLHSNKDLILRQLEDAYTVMQSYKNEVPSLEPHINRLRRLEECVSKAGSKNYEEIDYYY